MRKTTKKTSRIINSLWNIYVHLVWDKWTVAGNYSISKGRPIGRLGVKIWRTLRINKCSNTFDRCTEEENLTASHKNATGTLLICSEEEWPDFFSEDDRGHFLEIELNKILTQGVRKILTATKIQLTYEHNCLSF